MVIPFSQPVNLRQFLQWQREVLASSGEERSISYRIEPQSQPPLYIMMKCHESRHWIAIYTKTVTMML